MVAADGVVHVIVEASGAMVLMKVKRPETTPFSGPCSTYLCMVHSIALLYNSPKGIPSTPPSKNDMYVILNMTGLSVLSTFAI